VRKLLPVGAILLALLIPVDARAAAGQGQFVVRCTYSHTLMDDPIVFPGQPGASHEHDFFGNKSVDADSTLQSMLAADTTCRAASDTAGYWAPTASIAGKKIRPPVMRIYYLGTRGEDVETIPEGLQMIGGTKTATSADENPHVRWYCGETADVKTTKQPFPYDCTPYASQQLVDGVIAIIDLPNCWDGAGLTPEHTVYPENGSCPSGYPHVLPRLSERLHFGIMDPTAADGSVALTLSSGPYWTMHADFWNTWQQDRLDQLVDQCIDAGVHCGSIDALVADDWTREFGTSRYDLGSAADADARGNVAVAGFTNLRLPGERFRHRSDVFVRMIGAGGRERWTTQFGGSGVDQANAVAVGDDGIYVAGYTDGRFPKQDQAGGDDAFVAKLGTGGRLLWIRQFGTKADDRATSVAVAGSFVAVGGWTTGHLRPGDAHGGADGFVRQFRTDGTTRWTRQFGGPGDDRVLGMAGNGVRFYAAGVTQGGVGGPSKGGTDAFVRVMGTNGSSEWTTRYGTPADDAFTSISVALPTQIFVTGTTTGAFPDQTSSGGIDGVVQRIASDGTPVWVRQFGSPLDDEPASIRASDDGVYVAGSTLGALDGQTQLGESDAFVAKYLRSGALIWSRQFGTNDYDRTYGSALADDALYVTGTTHGAFEGSVNEGDRDVFVSRFRFT
jgi:uncharacterized protein DUF1996/beta-propeller repeat-containing protein